MLRLDPNATGEVLSKGLEVFQNSGESVRRIEVGGKVKCFFRNFQKNLGDALGGRVWSNPLVGFTLY